MSEVNNPLSDVEDGESLTFSAEQIEYLREEFERQRRWVNLLSTREKTALEELERTQNSLSYRVGRFLTWFPRKIEKMLKSRNKKIVYLGLIAFDYLGYLDFGLYSQTALIVSVSLFSIVMLSSLLGTITPLILDKLNFNPALASGPFITTTNDLIALAIYFIVALVLGGI